MGFVTKQAGQENRDAGICPMTPDLIAELPSTELIQQHGFPTYVAVVLLVVFVGLLAFFMRWFIQGEAIHRQKLIESIEAQTKATNVQTIALLNLQRQFATHDLTIRGLNPDAGANFAERDSKAFPIYQQMQRQLAEMQEKLKEK